MVDSRRPGHDYYVYQCSGRNKDLKLVGHIIENRTFCRLLIAVPLKIYSRFGRPKLILVGQMFKLVGKWPMADCYF